MTENAIPASIELLFNPATVRSRCHKLLSLAEKKELKYWLLDTGKLDHVATYVKDLILENYPKLDVPYHGRWRHIDCGDVDRISKTLSSSDTQDVAEQSRILMELTVTSVLVDAGAGMGWKYKSEGKIYTKSEGLAVAAYDMFMSGLFSHRGKPEVTAKGLLDLSAEKLQVGFQVSEENPIVGLGGRLSLLKAVGELISKKSYGFAKGERLGEFFDHLQSKANGKEIAAGEILKQVLLTLGPIWPGRLTFSGYNAGDSWEHYALYDESKLQGILPFHKLSQWLSYSLFEVMEHSGYEVSEMDQLTGLPEYRNGGLLIDLGVLIPKDPHLLRQQWKASDIFIIEWRGLTVALLDRVAELIRASLNMDAKSLPLAKVLQGGTWLAGRKIAAEKRADGGPPFPIVSDGTVF